MTAKVFKLNDYDWWIGESLESVKKAYLDAVELPEDQENEMIDDPHELTALEMENTQYMSQGESGAITFAGRFYEFLVEGYDGTPEFFATTEY